MTAGPTGTAGYRVVLVLPAAPPAWETDA
jgi:hypothetical protein